jgi:multiple sugar transport system substrate-binding protein
VDGPAMMMAETTPEIQMASWLFMKYLLSPDVQAKLVQAGYSLPVRASAMDLLTDFAGQNPVWAQAYQYALDAEAAPVSGDWGIKQWVLQDAIHRLLQLDVDDEIKPADVLQEVDAALEEMEGTTP